MANLVELSNQLEDFPEQQLVQMSQDPNSMYPSYLVLSEIQRRNQMRKMYEAQQPKPQTTVAEEVIGEFTGQQGLQGAMAQSPGPQDAFPPSDMGNMAPPSPMQAMASGGRTGYQVGGFTPTAENPYPTGSELVSDTFTPTVENEPGFFSNAINWAKENPADALSMAANATFFIPGVGVVAGTAIKGGIKLLPKVVAAAKKVAPVVKKGLQKTYTKPNPALEGGLKAGQRKVLDPKTQTSKMIDNTTGKVIPERVFSATRTSLAALPLTGTAMNLTQLALSPDEEEINPVTVQTQTEGSQEQVFKDVITGDANADKGLGQKFKDFANSSRGADMLVGLGGAIGSAKNLGELSSNISDAYFGVQSKRDAKDLAGLQGRLIEAQINKYEADVANMPLDIAIKQYQSLNDLVDSGVLTAEEAKMREAALMQRIQQLQGITVAEKNQRDKNLGLEGLITEVG
jgi:hypothetical protein